MLRFDAALICYAAFVVMLLTLPLLPPRCFYYFVMPPLPAAMLMPLRCRQHFSCCFSCFLFFAAIAADYADLPLRAARAPLHARCGVRVAAYFSLMRYAMLRCRFMR